MRKSINACENDNTEYSEENRAHQFHLHIHRVSNLVDQSSLCNLSKLLEPAHSIHIFIEFDLFQYCGLYRFEFIGILMDIYHLFQGGLELISDLVG